MYNDIGDLVVLTENEQLESITIYPEFMVGKPVIHGTRITVETVPGKLAHGATVDEIVKEYTGLTREDVQACLLFATRSLQNTAFMPLSTES